MPMKLPPLSKDDVLERLRFAERRLREPLNLNGGNLADADTSYRQQLLQEFFFHLVGSIEMLAQLVNEMHKLGIPPHHVKVSNLTNKLDDNNPIRPRLDSLYADTQESNFPQDPYSEDGYIYRIYNYRNHVTHRRRSDLFIVKYYQPYYGGPAKVHIMLDPRDPEKGPATKPIQEELNCMFQLIADKCQVILEYL